jgi:enoyl-CoA hydratase/carnithine racemase
MLQFKADGRVGELVINRPDAGNAFTGEMARQLGEIMREAAQKADIVIIRGEGADFTIGRDRHEPKGASPFDAFRQISAANAAMAAFPGILISKVRGRAFGFGVGLVMRSDIAFASQGAQFRLDEVEHGIPPMFIMEAMADHLAPKHALEIVLSGRQLSADDALRIGLVSRAVPAAALDEAVGDFVGLLRGRDRRVVLACKRYLRASAKLPADARPAFALIEQTEFAMSKA